MADSIITYDKLYDILRQERNSTELQLLDKEFFTGVLKYLREKYEILQSQKKKVSIFSSTEIIRTQKELDGIEKILKELYEKRESKIISMAINTSKGLLRNENIVNLLEEENLFYKEILDILVKYRFGILQSLLKRQEPNIEHLEPKALKKDEQADDETKLIRFLYAVPKFVGNDTYVYGPYEKEDIANLPLKVADLLISKSRAMEIKIKI